jgi:hypothetical protein
MQAQRTVSICFVVLAGEKAGELQKETRPTSVSAFFPKQESRVSGDTRMHLRMACCDTS